MVVSSAGGKVVPCFFPECSCEEENKLTKKETKGRLLLMRNHEPRSVFFPLSRTARALNFIKCLLTGHHLSPLTLIKDSGTEVAVCFRCRGETEKWR